MDMSEQWLKSLFVGREDLMPTGNNLSIDKLSPAQLAHARQNSPLVYGALQQLKYRGEGNDRR
jgi:hypothetical protein